LKDFFRIIYQQNNLGLETVIVKYFFSCGVQNFEPLQKMELFQKKIVKMVEQKTL